MKRIQILWIVCIGAGLWACSSVTPVYVQTDKVEVNTATQSDSEMDEMIQPYRDSLSEEMNRVIGYAKGDLINERPVGSLGNFVVDETMDYLVEEQLIQRDDYICIMNFGGLRAPISKGDIQVGDIYKLMPFDNTIVFLKLPAKNINEIADYLRNSGGEPIAGFSIDDKEYYFDKKNALKDTLYVVTTNYLANGGDKMSFLENPYEIVDTGIFLRDLLLDQVEDKDTIVPVKDQRIKL
ncbi:MAG: 5'-nucleotidase C-terminal domain-containing protein [Brumimicrobium sp.]